MKDKVEDWLHDQVCTFKMTLEQAQKGISTNWKQYIKGRERSVSHSSAGAKTVILDSPSTAVIKTRSISTWGTPDIGSVPILRESCLFKTPAA